MSRTINLKKGFDINIKGKPQETLANSFTSKTFAVKPVNFNGIAPIPKMVVAEGEEVLAGDVLFFNKKTPEIKYCSPVSGVVKEIKRGEKRAIVEVIIQADSSNSFKELPKVNLNASREDLVAWLADNGCMPFFNRRPYGVIPDINEIPRDIFVSGFDTAPLAPNVGYAMEGYKQAVQNGIKVLNKLTSGKVYLGVNKDSGDLKGLTDVEITTFSGEHPAGNVGIQIHHVAPINKGDIVWTINIQDLAAIGRAAINQQFDTERLIALGGPQVKNPQYYKTYAGANVENMLAGNLNNDHVRVISGNPLTGGVIEANGHLDWFSSQVTIIEEGDYYDFFGWLLPGKQTPSISKTFFWNIFGGKSKEFDVTTNTHGEHRAFVVTGEYEKVLPMDIFPMQLMKAIIANDLDGMEGLGIYEMIEEDIAICEYVCTSKSDLQKTLRQGLDAMREQEQFQTGEYQNKRILA